MKIRIEKPEALPNPGKRPGNSQWNEILEKVRNMTLGYWKVVQGHPGQRKGCTSNIKQAARSLGFNVEAHQRRDEIWIKRVE